MIHSVNGRYVSEEVRARILKRTGERKLVQATINQQTINIGYIFKGIADGQEVFVAESSRAQETTTYLKEGNAHSWLKVCAGIGG